MWIYSVDNSSMGYRFIEGCQRGWLAQPGATLSFCTVVAYRYLRIHSAILLLFLSFSAGMTADP
jgi:hypothetical protein